MSLHCDFCGLDFEPECAEMRCTACPLARNCRKISCPRCGYTFPAEAALMHWLRSLRPENRAKPLNSHPENQ